MSIRLLIFFLSSIALAGLPTTPSVSAPVPKEDWWLEIEASNNARHFVRVATGERRPVRAPRPAAATKDFPSPDGKWIAVVRNRTPTTADPFDFHPNRSQLFVRPVETKGTEVCLGQTASRGWAVAWSADSSRIAFLANRDGWRVCSAAPDGTAPRQLTQSSGFVEETDILRMLPDGRTLHVGGRKRVFDAPRWQGEVLQAGHLVISDGVRDRLLCRDSLIRHFEPSPDGTKVAYVVGNQSSSELVLHDLARDRADRIQVRGFHPDWECNCGNILWRPDGLALAFGFDRMNFNPFDDQAPFRHIGVVHPGPNGPRTEAILFRDWNQEETSSGSAYYSLIRWVSDVEVQRDSRR